MSDRPKSVRGPMPVLRRPPKVRPATEDQRRPPMTPAEEQAATGPYRETFLAGLRPDVAAALQQSGEFIQSALQETFAASPSDIPFDILFSRAALVDLEALVGHLSDLVDESGGVVQEHRFRDDLTEVLSFLRRAEGGLARTLADAEERRLSEATEGQTGAAAPRPVRLGAGVEAERADR